MILVFLFININTKERIMKHFFFFFLECINAIANNFPTIIIKQQWHFQLFKIMQIIEWVSTAALFSIRVLLFKVVLHVKEGKVWVVWLE